MRTVRSPQFTQVIPATGSVFGPATFHPRRAYAHAMSPLNSRAGDRVILIRLALGVAVSSIAGCVQVPVRDQANVSKANMTFNERGPFVYGPRINAQLEPGSADNAGATAAGCTACK